MFLGERLGSSPRLSRLNQANMIWGCRHEIALNDLGVVSLVSSIDIWCSSFWNLSLFHVVCNCTVVICIEVFTFTSKD